MRYAIQAMCVALALAAGAAGQYAGSGSCRRCHAEFFRLWATSHHGLAMQAYPPESAKIPADSVLVSGYTVRGGWMEEAGSGRRFPIRFALGGKNIFYFLTELDRGRLQVMPLAYDIRAGAWVDTAASMTLHQGGAHREAVDWRDRSLTFNTSCYGCHVSQLAINYDPKTDSYRSTWAEPGINCETCHGPAAAHVAQQGKGPILSMKRMSVERRNDACASCHAKLTPITAEFRPGERFFDHYDLAGLESDDFYPDGRDLRENFTFTTWRMSACARSGKLDCIHCHTSSGRYKFAGGNSDACLPCHEDRVRNISAHTHHAAESAGSRCVACHMPTTEYARMRRSDHSMRPPAPAATLAYGSPNACSSCHAERDAKWAYEQARKWFGDYQAPLLRRAALIAAARKQDWRALPEMLSAIQNDRDEIFRASLIRLLANNGSRAIAARLVGALADPSPLVRASAAEALDGFLDDTAVRALARAAKDPYRLVRIRAGAALAKLDMADPAARRAVTEYVASLRTRPDDFTQRLNLGVFYAARHQPTQALAEYRAALRLRPDYAPAYVNAGFVYDELGQPAKAEEAFRRAIRLDARSAAAHLNLGLLLLETRRLIDGERALRRAAELDPKQAVAAYNLALLTAERAPEEAVSWCRRAVANAPGEPKYRFTLGYLLTRNGRREEARKVLERALSDGVLNADGSKLLASLRAGR